jgi:transcriptional regulator with XRE-family HTH domain
MFNENLKRAMYERNITPTQLSALSGLSKSGISQYVSGKVVPSDKAKRKLAEALDVSVASLDDKTPCEDASDEPNGVRNLPVEQAARLMGKSKQFVRVSLQLGKAPFGFAVKLTGDKWTYHISPKKFKEYTDVQIGKGKPQ